MRTHLEDIRLANNAGISLPLCYASAPMLDLDKTSLLTVGYLEFVTCGNCKRLAPKRYPWAYARSKS